MYFINTIQDVYWSVNLLPELHTATPHFAQVTFSPIYINSVYQLSKKKKKKKNRWTEKEKNRHSQRELWQTAYWSLRQSERQDLAAQSFPFD